MIEDPDSRIRKCSASAMESMLSLPHGLCGDAAQEASQYSLFLRHFIDYLSSAGVSIE